MQPKMVLALEQGWLMSAGLPQVADHQQHSASEAREGEGLAQRTPHLQNGIGLAFS